MEKVIGPSQKQVLMGDIKFGSDQNLKEDQHLLTGQRAPLISGGS